MSQAISTYRHLDLATPCGGTTGSVNRSHCVIPARDGLIDSRPGADKRIRIVSVTGKACKLIENAEPEWHKAQEALMEIVGEDRWRAMCTLLRDTTRMVRHRKVTQDQSRLEH